MRPVLLLFFCLFFCSVSCTRKLTSYTSPTFRPSATTELSFATPLSSASYLVGYQLLARTDPFFSSMVARVDKQALLTLRTPLHLVSEVVIDSLERPALTREIRRAVLGMRARVNPDSVRMPLLNQLTGLSGFRYTMVLFSQGFARSTDNYAMVGGRSAHTGAMFDPAGQPVAVPPPIKSATALCVMIYDNQQQRIVYAQETSKNYQPHNSRQTARHLRRLLSSEFELPQAAPAGQTYSSTR
ncbi:hypothetical protein GCM10023185_25230 [Hymenobacter saemangeumensis]|uniref:DUF4136 domain-containing protein n=1 Tax=Hymenobacter saemangeumensis TaxID=1084522 RepID=A0ABP8IHK6_9BACT